MNTKCEIVVRLKIPEKLVLFPLGKRMQLDFGSSQLFRNSLEAWTFPAKNLNFPVFISRKLNIFFSFPQLQHGGLLLSLGLQGHLSKLGRLESFDYLIRGHELVRSGLVLMQPHVGENV